MRSKPAALFRDYQDTRFMRVHHVRIVCSECAGTLCIPQRPGFAGNMSHCWPTKCRPNSYDTPRCLEWHPMKPCSLLKTIGAQREPKQRRRSFRLDFRNSLARASFSHTWAPATSRRSRCTRSKELTSHWMPSTAGASLVSLFTGRPATHHLYVRHQQTLPVSTCAPISKELHFCSGNVRYQLLL